MSTPSMTGPHGIDLTRPGGIDQLLDFHRRTFGPATMSTATTDPAPPAAPPPGTSEPATPPSPPSPADVAARLRDQGSTSTSTTPPADGDIDSLPEWARDMVRSLRADAASANGRARDQARAEAAEAARSEVLETITRALGGDTGQSPATPEVLAGQVSTLTRERDEAQTSLRDARAELAVLRRAGAHRGDGLALVDSRSFMSTLSEVDPTDTAAVDTAIRDFLKDNPRYLARAAGSSSVDHPGGSGESTDPAASATPGLGRLRAAYATSSTTH